MAATVNIPYFHHHHLFYSYNVPTKEEYEEFISTGFIYNVPTKAEMELFKLLTKPNRSFMEVLLSTPDNEHVADAIGKAWRHLNQEYDEDDTMIATISGGSDSDLVVDICRRCDLSNRINYVWFDTGLEAQATKEHLTYLELKYDIKIERKKAIKPIPLAVKQYGQPFINKRVSEYMYRLQLHGFQWEDEPLEVLFKRYCKVSDYPKSDKWVELNGKYYFGAVSALRWWCNEHPAVNGNTKSKMNIDHNPGLKEYIMANPPTFKIAAKCCTYAKKKVLHELIADIHASLTIQGVRRAEGGQRADSYKSCFSTESDGTDNYRPIWWFTDADKEEYNKYCGIVNSDCYRLYGQRRTGCCGCPCALSLEEEKKIYETFEPKLYKAMSYVFKETYEYTEGYREFQKQRKAERKKNKSNIKDFDEYRQMTIFDYIA